MRDRVEVSKNIKIGWDSYVKHVIFVVGDSSEIFFGMIHGVMVGLFVPSPQIFFVFISIWMLLWLTFWIALVAPPIGMFYFLEL